MTALTLGSLFSGIGGFDCGFERAGFRTAWQVEIDTAASGVLARHWPDVPRHTDVRGVRGDAIEPVDVIAFGSPCQDLSVAGQRRGLAGERSGLYFEAIRIIQEMRDATDGRRPVFALWENVPGAHSSLFGRDYGTALDALAECGALDIAWRVLDSQWLGLAQRRARVFTLADFRGERAGEVLALAQSLRGDPAPRRTAGEDVAGSIGQRINRSHTELDGHGDIGSVSVEGHNRLVANGLTVRYAKGTDSDATDTLIVAGSEGVRDSLTADGFDASEDGTGRGTPIVARAFSENQQAEVVMSDYAHQLSGRGGKPAQGYPAVAVRTAQTSANGHGLSADLAHAVDQSGPQAVAFTNRGAESGDLGETLRAASHGAIPMAYQCNGTNINEIGTLRGGNGHVTGGVPFLTGMTVRRLTPRECERLQGFPDDWTRFRADGKEQADGPRYRQLGNAVSVPVAAWIARRVVAVMST